MTGSAISFHILSGSVTSGKSKQIITRVRSLVVYYDKKVHDAVTQVHNHYTPKLLSQFNNCMYKHL
jgi:hypothetical protein